ncbi:unnamed protein product [Orchesella dallaii]
MLLFILFFEIPAGMLAFLPVFVGKVPKSWKCISEHETVIMDSNEICQCNATRFSLSMTIVSEWELICESSWVVDSITTFQMFGMFFGNTIPPQISDWYGRKPTFIGLIFTMGLGQVGTALSINPYFFALSRFICGIGLAGYMTINGIYAIEFLTPSWRQLASCLGPLGEGVILLGILAYLIEPWRLLTWATAFPFISIIFMVPFLPESPRWLLKQKRIEEAEGVIRYIAGVNKAEVHHLDILKKIAAQESGSSDTRFSYLDLFRRKELRRKTILFIGIWFCWALQYFGISFNVRNFGVSPYLMLILLGGADCIGFRAALLVNNRLGRRTALILFNGVSSVFFLALGFIQLFLELEEYKILFIVFILLGKLGVAGARSSVRCLTVESYPVSIRTMGFGMARISAAIGGIAAPQLAYIGTMWPAVPLFTFAILGILGSLISILLKETGGKPLQDDLNAPEGNAKVVPIVSKNKKKLHKNGPLKPITIRRTKSF